MRDRICESKGAWAAWLTLQNTALSNRSSDLWWGWEGRCCWSVAFHPRFKTPNPKAPTYEGTYQHSDNSRDFRCFVLHLVYFLREQWKEIIPLEKKCVPCLRRAIPQKHDWGLSPEEWGIVSLLRWPCSVRERLLGIPRDWPLGKTTFHVDESLAFEMIWGSPFPHSSIKNWNVSSSQTDCTHCISAISQEKCYF
jgi:hypothetical protein